MFYTFFLPILVKITWATIETRLRYCFQLFESHQISLSYLADIDTVL